MYVLVFWVPLQGRKTKGFFLDTSSKAQANKINNTSILTHNFPLSKENNDHRKMSSCRCSHNAELGNQLVFIYCMEEGFCSPLLMVNKL